MKLADGQLTDSMLVASGGSVGQTLREPYMFLYVNVENHSFSSKNKRIGADCFLYFFDEKQTSLFG